MNIYNATVHDYKPVATPEDIIILCGADDTITKLMEVHFSGGADDADVVDLVILKRSTLNSMLNTGASCVDAIVPVKQNSNCGVALSKVYSYNDTDDAYGSLVGNVFASKFIVADLDTPTTAMLVQQVIFSQYEQPTLLSATEMLAINLGAAALTNGLIDVTIMFSEEYV